MRHLNDLPGDYTDITHDFLRSRFWLELLKPELEAEAQWAESHAAEAVDPWVRYGAVDYGKAFFNIRQWIKVWSEYPDKAIEESKEEGSDAPIY